MTRPLFELDPRLRAIADRVTPGCTLADIGTDHARLPVWLCREGVIARAIAADVAEGPLRRARENIALYGCEDRVEARLSDGLSAFTPDEADEVVIAGMGGELIARILEQGGWRTPAIRWFLQPMSAAEELREFLAGHGYALEEEWAVSAAGWIYTIMTARYTGVPTPCGEASRYRWIGLLNPAASAENRRYIRKQLRHIGNIYKGLCARGEAERAEAFGRLMEELQAMTDKEENA